MIQSTEQSDQPQVPGKPVPNQQVLWRYMPFEDFHASLSSPSPYSNQPNLGALILKRPSMLGDKYEGSLDPLAIQMIKEIGYMIRRELRKEIDDGKITKNSQGNPEKRLRDTLEAHRQRHADNVNRHFVLCWHRNEAESRAMWELYCPGTNGIAIGIRADELLRLTHPFPAPIHLRTVEYYNPDGLDINFDGASPQLATQTLLVKRLRYRHEREARLIVDGHHLGIPHSDNEVLRIPFNFSGMKPNGDPSRNLGFVMNSVIVTKPGSSPYFTPYVKDLLRNQDCHVDVCRSSLEPDSDHELTIGTKYAFNNAVEGLVDEVDTYLRVRDTLAKTNPSSSPKHPSP